MQPELPVSGVVPIAEMKGEDDDETERLRKMEAVARDFISHFDWCHEIRELYFGDGIGDVLAVFLARITPARPSVEEHLWIVVGDIPSAYLVTDNCPNPKAVLSGYIWEMRKWVALAKQGRASRDVIPVNVPATPEWARNDLSMSSVAPEVVHLSACMPLCWSLPAQWGAITCASLLPAHESASQVACRERRR